MENFTTITSRCDRNSYIVGNTHPTYVEKLKYESLNTIHRIQGNKQAIARA
ncbi:hypothetical protein H6G33_12120 [Calothrix sp. FACHB-1219]|uniref:hypothetical protein n=1 Tax=unclassified Calothrix TaxID=2619626 RepID=UPI0016897B81|nr:MULTISPECIES: hypothetical protein [unclassified Calothrix]MBD2202372.1 hypothetical protein [Calothrix sp. FACHB-168]MBD2217778.1 hypothetical protein [Calothrix sp. FACHB-1219]